MYHLRSSLPFLMNRVGVGIGELFMRDLAPLGLTIAMYRVLATLAEIENLTLGELAALTNIDGSTLSRVVTRLEAKRLVIRRRSARDARTVRVKQTAKGLRLARRLIPRAAHYEKIAVRRLSPRRVESLKRALAAIFDNLDTVARECTPAPRHARKRRVKSG